MSTFTIDVNDAVVDKFLWMLGHFKEEIHIRNKQDDDSFRKAMDASMKDVETGRIEAISDVDEYIEELRRDVV